MRVILCLFCAAILFGCANKKLTAFTVHNASAADRKNEMVEVPFDSVWNATSFILIDEAGAEIPYQLTYNNKLIFQASVKAGASVNYKMKAGTPKAYDTIATGKQYPERLDDIAWENDRIAFRTYGPALQASGEKAYGYDVWAKRVPGLVVAGRYRKELKEGITYHNDNGNGCDFYKVGPTLGAGTAALLVNDSIAYPYCYKNYEVLDNGPLRFTVKLTYNPITIKGDLSVVETRILSLDAGSQFNRVTVSYEGLQEATTVAAGIVLHDTTANYLADATAGLIAYADPKDDKNGQLYIAAILPDGANNARAVYFGTDEKKERGAFGHVLAYTNYQPGSSFTYYWGAGWNKWGFNTPDDWFRFVQQEAANKKVPLSSVISHF